MTKCILNIIIGLLYGTLSVSQHNQAEATPGITIPSINSFPVASNQEYSGIALPATGEIKGHDNGVILYSGNVRRRRLHGDWQSWYANKVRCDSGKMVKGVPTGEWKHWSSSGQLMALRTYDAGRLQRVKNEIQRNHPKEVVFPIVALHKKSSQKAIRYMQAGYSFGFTDQNRRTTLKEAVEYNITTGNSYRPLFDECLHHGLYMNFYENGTVRDSGHYEHGLKTGIWLHGAQDGSYQTGIYKNGMKQKEWKHFDAKNNLQSIAFFGRKGNLEWEKKIKR
jgi:antitoxin component YwqK of YwqJK toxin-antitoxin module